MKPIPKLRPAVAGNFGYGRRRAIDRITFHHIVGDAPAAISRFQTPGVEVSAHYVIGSDGTIYQCVAEVDTAYCDGNADSNARTISIEHAGGTASVPYTDAMYASSAMLVASLIQQYGISDFQRHREVIDKKAYPGGTACPGQLDVERIIKQAKGVQEMPLTPQQVDAVLKMGLRREPTAEELNNQAYANSPGLLIDTVWNNGGRQAYESAAKPAPTNADDAAAAAKFRQIQAICAK